MVVVLVLVAARLVQVQVLESPQYQHDSLNQMTQVVAIPALRGGIYDRNGAVLSLSVPTKMVIADDFQITHPVHEANRLAPLLGVRATTLATELHQHSGYVPLVHQLPEATAKKVAAGNFPGITMVGTSRRVMPNGALAQSVLGSTNAAGSGSAGLEYQYQKLLAGRPGHQKLLESPGGVEIPQSGAKRTTAVDGTGIELTLDDPLEYKTEQALSAALTSSHATSGTAIIMDVKTGQILSMVNLVAGTSGTVTEAPSNLAVTKAYEPGSVFKLVTFSAALQHGVITPNTTFVVPSVLPLDGSVFHDAEAHPTEQMTATQIIAQSSNIGTSEIAQRLGESRLLAQVRNLGFGQPTGLGFPGETGGILISAKQWEPTDYVDLPIGQVDAVTPLQILDAFNSVANGGVLVQPKLVRATVGSNGTAKATPSSPTRRVMSAQTASTLVPMLEQVVAQGTGTRAAIPGYLVAGKTGTANIPNHNALGYVHGAFNATFVGFAPADHPVLSSIVVLDRPTPPYGGTVSAPVFSQIMSYALHRYSIPTSPGAPTHQSAYGLGAPPSWDVTWG